MEYAKWKDQQLSAGIVSAEYEYEKKIRAASAAGELKCQDPTCPNKAVKYCHGKVRHPYFAHIENCECDYAYYERNRSNEIANLCEVLYKVLSSKKIKISKEIKLLKHHYSHLVIEDNYKNYTAVEFINRNFSVKRATYLTEKYREYGINVVWIEIGDVDSGVQEDSTYFAERFALNENNRTLIIVDKDLSRVAEYRMSISSYKYNDKLVFTDKELYVEKGLIENLTYENRSITFCGFNDKYYEWKEQRKIIFKNKCKEYYKELVYNERVEKKDQDKKALKENLKQEVEEEHKRLEVDLENSKSVVYDSSDKRVIKCKYCGIIGYDEKFISYGGKESLNFGTCKECKDRESSNYDNLIIKNKHPKVEKRINWGKICPECGSELIERRGKNGNFLGCKGFPNCKYTRSIAKN